MRDGSVFKECIENSELLLEFSRCLSKKRFVHRVILSRVRAANGAEATRS